MLGGDVSPSSLFRHALNNVSDVINKTMKNRVPVLVALILRAKTGVELTFNMTGSLLFFVIPNVIGIVIYQHHRIAGQYLLYITSLPVPQSTALLTVQLMILPMWLSGFLAT
jgi:hypothetical protein